MLGGITDQGVTAGLVKTLAFQESRLRVIAENIANAQSPGFRAKQLDAGGFQRALREAMNEEREDGGVGLDLRSDEVWTDAHGYLHVQPRETPSDNVLFHDGTNVSLEREMADLAQTTLWSELAGKLLQGRYDGLRKAIRGSV